MAAVGAVAAHAQYAPGLSPIETAKPWTLSADIRGFYDDNYLTEPAHFPNGYGGFATQRSSWGVEASPSVAFNHSVEDTLLSLSYIYDIRYYTDAGGTTDQSHQFNMRLDHEFSERDKVTVNEQFVSAQEPTVLDTSIVTSPLRANGNNIRNTGQLDWTHALSHELDLHLGYANTLYAFRQVGGDETSFTGAPAPYTYASRSAALDRMEQLGTLDLRWKIVPETVGVLGYQYGHVGYTSPEYIIYPAPGTTAYRANSRNDDEDFAFVGIDDTLAPNLNASVRVGAEYLDYYNFHTDRLSPYADASITYQYLPRSSAQLGLKEVHNSTDVTGIIGTTPVLDERTTAVYLNVNHEISDKFTISALGQAQFSTFNGGGPGYSGQGEDFYIGDINLAYHVNPFLIAEGGYQYNRLVSDLAFRGYSRDFVYLGLRATY